MHLIEQSLAVILDAPFGAIRDPSKQETSAKRTKESLFERWIPALRGYAPPAGMTGAS